MTRMKWFFGKKRASKDASRSSSKHLKVVGPDFWGKFDVFVDQSLHVAMFLPKADHSIHVLLGTPARATHHYTFNAAGKRTSAVMMFRDQIEWRMSQSGIQFQGLRLPDETKRYQAEVVETDPFEETINLAWIMRTVKDLQSQMADLQTKDPEFRPEAVAPEEQIERFAQMIRVHEDQAFGMRLLTNAHKQKLIDSSEISQTLLDSYPDLKQRETKALTGARQLLKEVIADMTHVDELQAYAFPAIQGSPTQDEITAQAQIYVAAYEQLFPGRNRGAFLAKKDSQRLTAEARKKLTALKVPYAIEDYLRPARPPAKARTEKMQQET